VDPFIEKEARRFPFLSNVGRLATQRIKEKKEKSTKKPTTKASK
jgi:hypothetical protein